MTEKEAIKKAEYYYKFIGNKFLNKLNGIEYTLITVNAGINTEKENEPTVIFGLEVDEFSNKSDVAYLDNFLKNYSLKS